jgi:outer membrane immunogenic protein
MKRFLLGTAAAVFLAAPAIAADMPVKAPAVVAVVDVHNWTGFYVGAHIGYGWSDKTWCDFDAGGCDRRVPGNDFANVDPSGLLGGAQAGFNWQAGQFVFGVEGQISLADINGSTVIFPNEVAHTKINTVATLAGRFGAAFNRTLLYVKGGAAWVNEDHWQVVGGVADPKVSTTRTGWMAGAGIEQAFSSNWSAKLEYNYMDFGRYGLAIDNPTDRTIIDQQVHVVKLGINYRFGGPVIARY